MAETLGSLCDKLTIIKLKQYHTLKCHVLIALLTRKSNFVKKLIILFLMQQQERYHQKAWYFFQIKFIKKKEMKYLKSQVISAQSFQNLQKLIAICGMNRKRFMNSKKFTSDEKNIVINGLLY